MDISNPDREVYIARSFRGPTRATIDQANAIIAEYQAAGFRLTLRQLYYQFVARDLFENRAKNYKKLGGIMARARDAGESDWDVVEDRSRIVNFFNAWSSPADFLRDEVEYYAEDLWEGQHFRPEVWVEKDALIGVVAKACEPLRVPYFSTHGYVGQLPAREAGLRFAEQLDLDLTPVVLHLADHDPAGFAMTRDVESRLERYAGERIRVRRIALNLDQVEQYRPPPNFAKEKDVNFDRYRREFGTNECWELDALAPDVIADLIRGEISDLIDDKKWDAAMRSEQKNRLALDKIAKEI
jgi:hypothetical protein